MILRLDREESEAVPGRFDKVTFGDLYMNGAYDCCTLEDEVREEPGKHVSMWKIATRTAIPSGTFRLSARNSPKFGPDTPVILEVPGFTLVEIHGGEDIDDTEGCIIVGSVQDRLTGRIHGAKYAQKAGTVMLAPVLAPLRKLIREALTALEPVFLQVRNAPAWYAAHGVATPKALGVA